jgi:hypothetical protein
MDWRKSVLDCLLWLGIDEVWFGLAGMAWNGGSWFWLDRNDLEGRKLVLAQYGGWRFWTDWNSLEWWKSVLSREVGFGLTTMASVSVSVYILGLMQFIT